MSLEELIAGAIKQYEADVPHLKGGLSSHGKCVMYQAFFMVKPEPFDAYGFVAPGTALHKYMQEEIFKPGSTFADWFVIIGHEQMVYLFDDDGKLLRQSPIDTVVFNLLSNEFEIWDYKSAGKDTKYITKLDPVYKAQANLYAYLFMKNNNLPYLPRYRVLFFSKRNWLDIKVFTGKCSPILATRSILRIKVIPKIAEILERYYQGDHEDLQSLIRVYPILAEGLRNWSSTKTPYLKECKYCPYQGDCVEFLRKATGRLISVSDLTDGNREKLEEFLDDFDSYFGSNWRLP